MKLSFALLIFFIIKVSLTASEIDVRNFSGSIVGDTGLGQADYYVYPTKFESPSLTQFEFEKSGDYFTAISGADTFSFDLPSIFGEVSELYFKNLSMKESQGSFSLNLNSLSVIDYVEKKSSLSKLNFKCNGVSNLSVEMTKKLLTACPLSSTLSVDQVDGETELKEVALSLTKNKLNLSAKLKQGFWVTAKGDGEVHYVEADGVLRVKINKVTAAGMNVTDTVFDELRKINDPSVVVVQPFVYITVQ
jgi:hypothetical protein